MVLDEEFIEKCREAFNSFDTDGSGTIDAVEMKLLLTAIGEAPNEEELFKFMADVDEDGTGEIEFAEFLHAFEKQRDGYADTEDESDTLDAFVALGGNRDRSGFVDKDKLMRIVKEEFGMTIKVDRLMEELDHDKDGKINFAEFANLFM
ncbi:calmodulin, putative [Perkinsus marinus ATCC 50983]|uniref:Calmodulin n=1 Tax=Perkinsus marinus (strain ATCC 50983 / TXsc) TaxID=423536 RepID=C5LTF4_PERM5|nr:calmodulin, putative [Perkinsus marinus ATCC 50983]EER00122.1 calmodulin, putative [Perkinsus marinus ATCC 50983]|eukprot:XP_002767404.1 calmodulin, putative [Perkinsus marinus ATCC 50983]